MLIGCIVQARMGSTRLPGKVIMKIENNDTMIDFVIHQLQFSKTLNKIMAVSRIIIAKMLSRKE